MANQKISQLTEQTDLSLIDGLAGYEGTSNVRISGASIDSSILRPSSGDVDVNPSAGKIQVKQSNFQWNGTGSQTYIRSSNLPDYYLLMPGSNIHYNLYDSALAPNGKSFIGWIGGKVQLITGHPTNATHGGFVELTSKGNSATLQTQNAADWGNATGAINAGAKIIIDSAAEDVEINVRPYGSIKIGTQLISSVSVNFSGATDGQYNGLVPGTSAGVTTSGDGAGLKLALTIAGGVATSIRVSAATSNSVNDWDAAQGKDFKVGDTITFAAATFGGIQDMTITLTELDLTPATIDLNGSIKQQSLASLTGTTPSWNIRTNYNAELTIDAAGSTLTIQGALAGDYGTVIVDSSASTSLTFPAGSVYPGGTAPTLTGTANKDVLSFLYDGTNYYWTSALDFS